MKKTAEKDLLKAFSREEQPESLNRQQTRRQKRRRQRREQRKKRAIEGRQQDAGF